MKTFQVIAKITQHLSLKFSQGHNKKAIRTPILQGATLMEGLRLQLGKRPLLVHQISTSSRIEKEEDQGQAGPNEQTAWKGISLLSEKWALKVDT